MKRIALIGNPNCGKTTLFNRLTGLGQKTSNLPGTTIEAYIGKSQQGNRQVEWVDLPGIYSLFSDTEYEHVVISHLLAKQTPKLDGIIFVFDASNLRRNLLLYSQVAELGIPAAGVLTMNDTAKRRQIELDTDVLEQELGISILRINPRKDPNSSAVWQLSDQLKVGKTITKHDQFKERLIRFSDGIKDRGISEETLRRYAEIDHVVKRTVRKKKALITFNTLKIDRILTHPLWGLLTFILIMLILFQGVFSFAEAPMGWIEHGFAGLRDLSSNWFENPLWSSFWQQGIISGLEGVVIFLPQIFILFFLIGMLEDSGYMVRASFISDSWMRRIGLNGRSIIPLIGGFACAIPSIMASRTIRNKRERLATMIVVPLMSCSARLPVYVLLTSLAIPSDVFWGPIPAQTALITLAYFAGIFMAIFISFLFQRLHKNEFISEFVLELPTYQAPRMQTVFQGAWLKCKSFLGEAGKVILIISLILWGLSSFGPGNSMQIAREQAKIETQEIVDLEEREQIKQHLENTYKLEKSYAGVIGKTIEPAIEPLGFDWKTGIALITSFAAREVFVGTMSTLFTESEDTEDLVGIRKKMQAQKDPISGEARYGFAYAISLMLFYAFALQCMSTMAVLKKETGNWIWPVSLFILYGVIAYLSSWLAYSLLR